MPSDESVILTDGSTEFTGGVDSLKPTTVAGRENPNGLPRNQLAWLVNGTVRDGGISPRSGWQPQMQIAQADAGFYQGGFMYQPLNDNPHLVLSIGGTIYKVVPDAPAAENLTPGLSPLKNPVALEQSFFCQGEEFLVIQAGDGLTLPLFWDGTTLRRSVGLLPPNTAGQVISTDSLTIKFPPEGSTTDITWTSIGTLAVGNIVQIFQTYTTAENDGDYIVKLPGGVSGTTLQLSNRTIETNPNSPFFLRPQRFSGPGTYQLVKGGVVVSTDTLTLPGMPRQPFPPTYTPVGPWTSVAGISPGDRVTINRFPPDAPQGTYLITAVSGTKLTLQRTDANASPYTVTGTFKLVFQTGAPASAELPAGYQMDYYMQRLWYVFGDRKTYTAGDIVGNTGSGTIGYGFRDSILKVTENPLALGGDGFHLPSNSGEIRALTHQTNLNAQLGQGQLYISTRKQIYALQVPVSRADWIAANSTNAPLQTVIQTTNGAVGDRCIVPVNGDLYYQSITPDVRSLINAVRYFNQPGNTGISNQEERILQFTDRSLIKFATGIEFDNRCLQSALPKRLPQGIVHQGIMPLDFTPISEFGAELAPVWEGHWEGLDVLQLFTGDFGGLQRSFAVVVSRTDGSIWLWEVTQGQLFENGDNRITWQVETPAWTFGREFDLKRLVGGELWFDRLFGTAEVTVDYRTDGNNCWTQWIAFKECSARNCRETIPDSCLNITYPPSQDLGYGYRNTVTLPKPPVSCDKQMNRPSDLGHQFQLRITVHGSLRLRGIFVHGTHVQRKLYSNGVC